jgi:PAS domain-containing protein
MIAPIHRQRLLEKALEAVLDVLNLAVLAVWTIADGRVLRLAGSAGARELVSPRFDAISVGQTCVGRAAVLGVPSLVTALPAGDVDTAAWARTEGLESFLACRLVHRGRIVGLLAGFDWCALDPDALTSLQSVAAPLAALVAAPLEESPSDLSLASLAELVPQALFSCEASGRILWMNPTALSLLALELAPSQGLVGLAHPNDRLHLLAALTAPTGLAAPVTTDVRLWDTEAAAWRPALSLVRRPALAAPSGGHAARRRSQATPSTEEAQSHGSPQVWPAIALTGARRHSRGKAVFRANASSQRTTGATCFRSATTSRSSLPCLSALEERVGKVNAKPLRLSSSTRG